MTSDLIHPRKRAARLQFYPHTVSIGKFAGSATSNDESNYQFISLDGHAAIRCAYGPKEGAMPQLWQSDASGGEVILLAGYYPDIKKKSMQAVLIMEGVESYFRITDVLHRSKQTLLVVAPHGSR